MSPLALEASRSAHQAGRFFFEATFRQSPRIGRGSDTAPAARPAGAYGQPVYVSGAGFGARRLRLLHPSELDGHCPVGWAGSFLQPDTGLVSCAGTFQCATLTVPLDYANPAGRSIVLAVIRARATDSAYRIGSLITNPGGPGGSGVEFVRQSYSTQPGQPSHFGAQL